MSYPLRKKAEVEVTLNLFYIFYFFISADNSEFRGCQSL